MTIQIRNISIFNIRFRSRLRVISLVMLMCLGPNVAALAAGSETTPWSALQSGNHFALLRHAIAPGTGDPPQFMLGQCATQRNLSDEGRDQAVKIGHSFRENGILSARVFSSQWCRCMQTAELLGLGPVAELTTLNSFYQRYERRQSRTQMLLQWLAGQDLERPLVLVTHQVNITALTGIYPGSGELVIVHRSNTGVITVIATIESP